MNVQLGDYFFDAFNTCLHSDLGDRSLFALSDRDPVVENKPRHGFAF
jgi:hypothetical protein